MLSRLFLEYLLAESILVTYGISIPKKRPKRINTAKTTHLFGF